jgi:hypothetical protein
MLTVSDEARLLLARPKPVKNVLELFSKAAVPGWMNEGEPLTKRMMQAAAKSVEQANDEGLPTNEMADKGHRKLDSELTLLVNHWQVHMASVYRVYQKPLTQKDIRILKMLHEECGEVSLTLVEYALNNWSAFCLKAQHDFNLMTYPASPSPRFLFAYLLPALELMVAASEKEIAAEKKEITAKEQKAVQAIPYIQPLPICKKVPIRVMFTPEQFEVLIEPDGEKYKKFMAALGEKYGEDCIISGLFVPGKKQILCDIAV